jgi:quinol monooxygenase YgiN
MRQISSLLTLIGITLTTGLSVQNAAAQPSKDAGGSVYVVTYVDLTPNYATEGVKLLQQFAADSRKDPGVVRFELVRQDSRGNHLALLEVWRSRQAFDAHSSADHTKEFREKLHPMLGSPWDERLHSIVQ